jgi:hypothetical protein
VENNFGRWVIKEFGPGDRAYQQNLDGAKGFDGSTGFESVEVFKQSMGYRGG